MEPQFFRDASRPVVFRVNIESLTGNINAIRSLCKNKNAGIIAMVKGNAYGHGSAVLSRHLEAIGVERFGVASIDEGMELRQEGIKRPIHLMGNVMDWEMTECLRYNLTPTVSSKESVIGMASALKKLNKENRDASQYSSDMTRQKATPVAGTVHIKIDSGMSRNGCQPDELDSIVQLCDELDVPLEGMFTHFGDYENEEFTKQQLETYLNCIEPYRSRGLLFHTSNSGAIISGIGTDLDFVRPGISMYGLAPGENLKEMDQLGFRPIGSLVGTPTLVKQLPKGRTIGYGCSYETKTDEWIATIPLGYGDGFFRSLSNNTVVVRDLTQERCPLVGRVSMDGITFRTSGKAEYEESFTLISPDYNPITSASGMAIRLGTISYEITTRLMPRIPRIYIDDANNVISIRRLVCNLERNKQ